MENGTDTDKKADFDIGHWVMALRAPGTGFIGRIHSMSGDHGDTINNFALSEVVHRVLDAEWLALSPVIEYREMVKEVPRLDTTPGGPARVAIDPRTGTPLMLPTRTPLPMPVGFTLEKMTVYVPGLKFGTMLIFMGQMHAKDRATYRTLYEELMRDQLEQRMLASGLTLPKSGDVPGRSA